MGSGIMRDNGQTPDELAFDYLFQLYNNERHSYWNKVNYYIIIETALFTLLATRNHQSFLNGTMFSITLVGIVVTLYVLIASLIDSYKLYVIINHLLKLQPRVVGHNRIFVYRRGVLMIVVDMILVTIVLVIWAVLAFQYPSYSLFNFVGNTFSGL